MSVYSNEINQMIHKILEKVVYEKDDERILMPKNMTLLDFFILKRINAKDKVILTDLKDEVDIDYNTIRKEISYLENLDLINKIEDPNDKRRKFIQVTKQGKEQIKESEDQIEEKLKFVIKDFSVNEEKAVLKFLSRINQLTLTHFKK
jgi:DNA-binding MarR family transcriptional regulator